MWYWHQHGKLLAVVACAAVVLGRQRQEGTKFKGSLGYIASANGSRTIEDTQIKNK
jgi:hypothetical protein